MQSTSSAHFILLVGFMLSIVLLIFEIGYSKWIGRQHQDQNCRSGNSNAATAPNTNGNKVADTSTNRHRRFTTNFKRSKPMMMTTHQHKYLN